MKKIAIIMGSDSDLPIAKKAVDTLKEYSVPYTVRVLSAHRTAEDARHFALQAREEGYGVIIAFAGMAAHLAGAMAANSCLPVIGVPVASGSLAGFDALLSTVQMPSGIPVATVAVNGGKNAALLALQMLAIGDEALYQKLLSDRKAQEDNIRRKNEEIERQML